MKREYSIPKLFVTKIENSSILCSSSTTYKKSETHSQSSHVSNGNTNIYSSLTHRQKLAAMNLMGSFGGFCQGTNTEIDKIDRIMSVEGNKMGVSGPEVHAAEEFFPEIQDMVNSLKGANKEVLESLFWTYYCIIAVGKSAQAVQLLLAIYKDLGISEQECVSILENKTGKKIL